MITNEKNKPETNKGEEKTEEAVEEEEQEEKNKIK